MADELSIQQQPSKLPYVLGSAAVGATGAGIAAHFTTKPKYASHEDLIKETDDKFETTAKEVMGDDATAQKAVNARKEIIEAGKNWDNEKANFMTNFGDKSDEYQNLVNSVKDKKKALEIDVNKSNSCKTDDEIKNAVQERLTKAEDGDDLVKQIKEAEKAVDDFKFQKYIEQNGSREEAVGKVAKEHIDDLVKLVGKKINWAKIGTWAGAAAAVFGLGGYIFAPKGQKEA